MKRRQRLHLLERSPLDTLPKLLVTPLLRGHATLKKFQSSSYGQAMIIKFRQECNFWRRPMDHSLRVLVTSLLRDNVTFANVNISSYGWTSAIKFGQHVPI